MLKYGIIGALIILLAAVGFYVWKTGAHEPTSVVPEANTMSTYASSTLGFSIEYPQTYTVDGSYAYDQVNPKKPIHGVKFTIPGGVATGTNLASDTYISVESLPRAKRCTGDIYLAANVKPQTMSTASTTYSVATSSGAGAGNFYEEMVYAIESSKPCTAVRYYIHTSNIGNYDPGTVREFDRTSLLAAFDKIRNSLVLNPAPSTNTP